jgi:hypothetical protein
MERGQIKIPRHEALIRELTYYRFERTAAGNVKLGAPEGAGHSDDLVTAMALALKHAWRRGGYIDTDYDDIGGPEPQEPYREYII